MSIFEFSCVQHLGHVIIPVHKNVFMNFSVFMIPVFLLKVLVDTQRKVSFVRQKMFRVIIRAEN